MTNETPEIQLYEIAEANMERLTKEINKLNRRAAKIGCEPLEIVIHKTEKRPDPVQLSRLKQYKSERGEPISKIEIDDIPLIDINTVEIVGEGPKIEGYKFIGTLDHYTIQDKVIVNTVPGETVPPQFFEASAICNHCDKIRRRTETFVVENLEDGSYIQVGRNCLRDFFGHDPQAVARWLSRVLHFVASLEEDDDDWRTPGGRYEHYYNAMKVLTNVVAVIRTLGYVSRKAAQIDETKATTTGDVRWIMSRAIGKEREAQKRFIASIDFRPEEDLAEAEAAVAWLKEQEGSNEYMHNLKLLEDEKAVPSRMFGYWASLIPTYQRAMDRLELARIERENSLNEHLGEVGQRLTDIRVRCKSVKAIAGHYGTVNIHRMKDEDGRTLVWFANTEAKMTRGHEYVIRATIKKHDEYEDWAQTHLNRVMVLEEIETEDEEAA